MSFLDTRDRQPELMDDPGLETRLHRQALDGLRRVHAISGTVSTLWQSIRQLAAETPTAPLRVLDVACGGGDIAIALAKRARRAGVALEVSGCDLSRTALDVAVGRAAAENTDVHFFQADVLSVPLPEGYDVVCCSLFLHHLNDEDAVRLMALMKQAAGRSVLISDLIRSRLGYVLTWCGLRLLTRSRICHVDGPLSVRAAFSVDEVRQLADQAELHNVTLTRHWPQRFLMQWNRS